MKSSFLALLMFLCFCISARCQNTFKNKLPELETRILLDSAFQIKPFPISRAEVWSNLVLPMERIAKGNLEEDFPVDSASIVIYEQWKNVDSDKKVTFINFYSPTFNGELYAFGKRSLKDGLTGVFWGFRQKDFIYGNGDIVWFVLYDQDQRVIDYKKVYENLKGGTPRDSFVIYTSSELNNEVLKTRTFTKVQGKRKQQKVFTYKISSTGIKQE